MILVTGATGQCGGALMKRLLAERRPLRALTRSPEQPVVEEYRRRGVDVVEGDMLKPETLSGLFDGVEQAFLVTTPQSGFEEEVAAGINFIEAAKAQKLRHLVFLSVVYAETPTPHCATKGAIEAHLRRSGVGFTTLRAGYFLETLPNYFGESALRAKTIVSVIKPSTPIYWISIEDIGLACARVLERNQPQGKTYDLACPSPLSMSGVAELFGESVGQEIKCVYTPVTIRGLLQGLVAAGFLDGQKAARFLRGIADPEADYHAAVSSGDVPIDPNPLVEEFALRLTDPADYVRHFSRQTLTRT